MKKLYRILTICFMISILVLSGCAMGPEETVPTETDPPEVDIGGTSLDCAVETLDLTAMQWELDALVAAAPRLQAVRSINLGTTDLTWEQFVRLENAFPSARIDYSIELFGQTLASESTYLDASAMTVDQTEELLNCLPMLPMVTEVNFVSEEGGCVYTVDTIRELDRVREALPEASFHVSFELFGQTVTSEQERVEYYCVEIGNEGADTVRAVLPYLKSCTYFLMDGCGIDYEILAQMRDDFPDTEIVWRVWLVEENYNSRLYLRCGSYLTDTHRIRTTYVTDKNSHLLNYCTKTKYVDVGHVWALTQCDFLSYMPDLEVCILAITEITDITPLANHEKLEYLELFTTDIEDLTPLISCPNIEHLNISNMPKLQDISPIFELTKLKRLRMVDSPLITDEQKQEAEERLPDCEILKMGHFATAWFWRYGGDGEKVERYALLCEQMEYEIDAKQYGIP